MLKALIFDFDGLILDTETPEYTALNEVYNEYGFQLPVETYGMVVGAQYGIEYEPLAHLCSLTGMDLNADVFWRRVNKRRMDLIGQNPILPGVVTMLREAKSFGLKLAVASSSAHKWVDPLLKQHDLFCYFDVIKCKDDVRNIKPDPELFLAALGALDLKADEAVIFEDSLNGVLAAQLAGIRVVLIPNTVTQHLNIQGETLRAHSMAELSLVGLLSKL